MTKTYVKPIVVVNPGLTEGIYAASGGDSTDCYTCTARIHQTPETGRETYVLQVDADHHASDSHHSGKQVLDITFNQPVTYVSSGGELSGGDGTATLNISYKYHNNGNDHIGLGNLEVKSEANLSVVSTVLHCNMDCGQHKV